MSLGKKTVQGVIWSFVSFGSSKLLTFVTTIILTRLLVPELFGQVALAAVIITGLDAIGNLGIGAALIYMRDNIERAARVAFTISVIMGALLTALVFLGAPLVGAYFGDSGVVPLLQVLAFHFIIQALGSVHSSLMSKELSFKRKLIPNLSRNLVKGVCSITLALMGWGAWSLVWGQILAEITTTIALWIVQPFRPRFLWDSQLGRTMLSYGLQVIGVTTMAVLYNNADYVIVGKVLGAADLAVYRQAFIVADLLILSFCYVTGSVLFPSYAKLNNNLDALRTGVLATVRYISLITLPISIGLCAVAPLFVRLVFTPEWHGMIVPLQWLALRAGVNTLSFNAGSVFNVIGRPLLLSRLIVVRLVILVPIVLFSVRFGVVGVAAGQLAMAIIAGLLDFWMVSRVIELSRWSIWQSLQSQLVAAVVMGVVVWMFVVQAPANWLLITLLGAVSLGAVVYLGVLWVIERQFLRDSFRMLLDMVEPKAQAMVKQEG